MNYVNSASGIVRVSSTGRTYGRSLRPVRTSSVYRQHRVTITDAISPLWVCWYFNQHLQ